MARGVPAVLVLSGLLSCAVLGKYSAHQKQPLMRADFHAETTLCQTTPGLRRPQVELCRRLPDVTGAALQGLQVAVKECQHQFRHHRWNCSSLATRAKNPYTSAIFQKGFRETAFAYAISTAGVVLSVAKACSQGSLKNCSCDTHKYKMKVAEDLNSAWKMGGCSHNLHYGIRFSKKFLDSRESGADIHSEINLHNNHVGRMVVAENMQKKCKCHGVSGACEFKTCWRAVPDIRVVGRALKEKFRQAVLVYQSNLVNRDLQKNKPNQKKAEAAHKTEAVDPPQAEAQTRPSQRLALLRDLAKFLRQRPNLRRPGYQRPVLQQNAHGRRQLLEPLLRKGLQHDQAKEDPSLQLQVPLVL